VSSLRCGPRRLTIWQLVQPEFGDDLGHLTQLRAPVHRLLNLRSPNRRSITARINTDEIQRCSKIKGLDF
jgi:hypothetical protein